MARILITGAAGFIGAHLARTLSMAGHVVVGCDNFDPRTGTELKRARVNALLSPHGIPCLRVDLTSEALVNALFERLAPLDAVVHLAGLAGVQGSMADASAYVRANVVAFSVLLQACAQHSVGRVLYASSSSVYGARSDGVPFHEDDRVDEPASPYAASKLAMELLARSMAPTLGLRLTGLRLFTVYGPWGRPDMAYAQFAERILREKPITLYGQGEPVRDFTYIDDAVHAIQRLLARSLAAPVDAMAKTELFNVGHHQPVRVIDFVRLLERALGRTATLQWAPLPVGDVPRTCADPDRLIDAIGPWPQTPLDTGLARFASWYRTWVQHDRTAATA